MTVRRTDGGQPMAQDQQRARHDENEPDEPEAPPVPAAPQSQDSDVDALLDDIDEVLESNAESFVRGFVQKGGE
ncbi:ubiquitin-like protein Pup [Actinotalea sp. M2MS4P-6]|uniref:ubiquitin-like protein Pup n=1 Tax=Actinotalea sp. M2MS4P-6 TaxID=2983762 RepID=UPI0021E3B98B|nr:ubiquitin-like protein Pup [Actinotalea sp. M2MS4P-6]MCV2394806.1 ubiquitin-like protein Pup [Actinotalea sp. M2MS4P-6]